MPACKILAEAGTYIIKRKLAGEGCLKQGNSRDDRIIEEDVCRVLEANLPWEKFHSASVLVTGGTGMLPSFLALTLLRYRAMKPDCDLKVSVLARNVKAAKRIYAGCWEEPWFHFIEADVCSGTFGGPFDYVIHGASPADPRRFGEDPASVFLPNVLGLYNILKSSQSGRTKGVLFMSSGEVYGHTENIETLRECDYGSVDPLDVRSCYAEGKRAGETLCKIWAEQYGVPAKVVRISHTYGPTMDIYRDSRSFAEFVRCVVERGDIQLKSDGSAVRPFCYATDCAEGMLRVLLLGESGKAYNLAGDEYCSILELAERLCGLFPERGLHVVRTVRDSMDPYLEAEKRPVVRVDISCLKALGWAPKISIAEGFRRTILSIEAEKNE